VWCFFDFFFHPLCFLLHGHNTTKNKTCSFWKGGGLPLGVWGSPPPCFLKNPLGVALSWGFVSPFVRGGHPTPSPPSWALLLVWGCLANFSNFPPLLFFFFFFSTPTSGGPFWGLVLEHNNQPKQHHPRWVCFFFFFSWFFFLVLFKKGVGGGGVFSSFFSLSSFFWGGGGGVLDLCFCLVLGFLVSHPTKMVVGFFFWGGITGPLGLGFFCFGGGFFCLGFGGKQTTLRPGGPPFGLFFFLEVVLGLGDVLVFFGAHPKKKKTLFRGGGQHGAGGGRSLPFFFFWVFGFLWGDQNGMSFLLFPFWGPPPSGFHKQKHVFF